MPIRVDVNGQMVEFPDGTPDDVIDAAVKRDFFGPQGNAITRFGKKFVQAINPIPAVKAVFKDPRAVAKSLVDTRDQFYQAGEAFARAIPGGNVEPSVMDPRSRADHAVEGAYRAVAAIPGVGPVAHGLTQDLSSMVKSGDLAGAAGTVAGLAAGPKIVAKAAAPVKTLAPLLRRSAEKGYGKVFGEGADAAKVARVVPELIERRVKVKEPKGELTRLADENMPLVAREKGKFAKNQGANAKLWRDTKTLAQDAPAGQTIGQVVKESVPPLIAGAVATKVAPIVGAPLTAGKVLQTVKAVMETPQFRSSSAIAQAQLADAINAGRLDLAAAIAGQIMRGGAVVGEAHQQALQDMMRKE